MSEGRDTTVDRTRPVISSVRVEVGPAGGHDRIRVWNRGALSGELVVAAGDGWTIARRLEGHGLREELSTLAGIVDEITERLDDVSTTLASAARNATR